MSSDPDFAATMLGGEEIWLAVLLLCLCC